jgi:hypothetical protein
MKRGGPLRRKTPLKPGKPLERRTRLRAKPKEPMSVEEKLAAALFGRADRHSACVVCGATKWKAWQKGTKLEAHHVVSKQKLKEIIKTRGLDKTTVLWDTRNRLWVCGRPCHENHTTRFRPIPFSKVPRSALVFAAEYGLTYVIERDYPVL